MHQMFIKVFILTEVYKVPRAQPKLLTMSQMFTTNWFTMSQVFTRNNGLQLQEFTRKNGIPRNKCLQETTVYHHKCLQETMVYHATSVYKKQWFTMPEVFTKYSLLKKQHSLSWCVLLPDKTGKLEPHYF